MRTVDSDGPHRPRGARRALVLTAGAALLAPAAVALPGTASAASVRHPGHVTHPQLDWAGSTVAAHEGRAKTAPVTSRRRVTQTPGLDVSSYQGDVDWKKAWKHGARFAYVKATEATSYTNPYFAQQYNGSYKVGMIRGAYHFATPDTSAGRTQADWFVAHGGRWSRDGRTLPPMLDIEYNPYGAKCFGKSHAAMVGWIRAFVNEVHARTTRWATIYTTTDWWRTCTGNTKAFSSRDPLFVADYNGAPKPLPAGWRTYTVWQYADSGTFPGDQDRFNGALSRVRALADNT